MELFYQRPGVAGSRRIHIKRTAIDPRLTVTPAANGNAATGRGVE